MRSPADPAEAARLRDWAESGVAAITGPRPGPPLAPPGVAASDARALGERFLRLVPARRRGRVPAAWHRLLAERAALVPAPVGACRVVACRDGWLAVNLPRPSDLELLPAWLERPAAGPGVVPWEVVEAWARTVEVGEAVARGVLLGLAVAEVPAVGGGPPNSPPVTTVELAPGPAPRPDATPLVVDLSALWAGPLAASLLTAAGGRVVKVETPDRLDGARRGDPAFYDLLHGGQESVLVEPRTRPGRRLLDALLERADIVLESSRPRAIESWGVDRAAVAGRRPSTWVSITAHGPAHPDRVGFGDDVAMAAGLVVRRPGDGRPMPVGDAIADPLAGLRAAFEALESFRRGGGRHVQVSMRDVAAATLGTAPGEAVPATAGAGGWVLGSGPGAWPVAAPARRPPPPAPAPAPGRHTGEWRSRLGCEAG